MSKSEQPNDRIPTERLRPDRVLKEPAKADSARLSRYSAKRTAEKVDLPQPLPGVSQPLSARAAAAQFDLAALLETQSEAPHKRSLVASAGRSSTDLTTRPPANDGAGTLADVGENSRDSGRLPSAWYKQADELAEAARKERAALIIRGSAAVCLGTGAALLFWLGSFGSQAPIAEPPSMAAGFASVPRLPEVTSPTAVDPASRGLVTTAQILAVAERFVATGDILAARAMLSEKAAAGDPRAIFALAETYDPNLLASWNAHNIEASPAYARLLYDAALQAGMTDAQTRLDALR